MKYMKSLLRRYWLLLIPTVFFLGLLVFSGSILLAKKIIVFLVLPAGLVWIGLTYALFWPCLRKSLRVFLGLMWLLYTLAGNPILGNRLLQALERPYVSYANPSEAFDILFVLGGGTSLRLDDETPQVNSAGDRVIAGARHYHNGKAKKLAASGRSVTEIWGQRDLSAETIAIWRELGVPEADTIGFSTPRNTREEITEYQAYLEKLNNPALRIGICTSAWHMRRTERLWRSMGVEATPVPADFRSRPIPVISTYLIPKKRGFAHVQEALWEYLGMLEIRLRK